MKKICFITDTRYGLDEVGIGYKIYKQIDCFRNNGCEVVENPKFLNTKLIFRLLNVLPFVDIKFNYRQVTNIKNLDGIFIRYFFCNRGLVRMLKKLKKRNVRVIIEIPTYPYEGEFNKFLPKMIKDRCNRKKLAKYVDHIVTYSDDKTIFGIPTINISNGVDMTKLSIVEPVPGNQGEIHMISVARISFWHGFDRIIEGLYLYLMNEPKTRFYFHIVGEGTPEIIEQYKKMIAQYHLEEYVILHGKRVGKELDKIYNMCDIAIDSLGRHRSKVYYNSSLKGKEYLAKGLPIVSGVTTELDSMPEFKYYLRVPADDSPCDLKLIEEFFHSIYDNRNRFDVIHSIRNFCQKNFEFDIAFQPVVDKMLE